MPITTALILFFAWNEPVDCQRYAPFLNQFTGAYFDGRPMDRGFDGDLTQARELRDCLAIRLQPRLGPIIGYKAALTSEAAQKRFGVRQPVLGLLLAKMLRPQASQLPVKFGAIPLCEADLILRIGDTRINRAHDESEAMASIDAVIPFLELPDAVYGPDVSLNAASIAAVNAGARLGIIGEPIAVSEPGLWLERLARIEAILLDEKGTVLRQGGTRAFSDHPLKIVLWIRDALVSRGKHLKKGDLLSLGSLTPPLPIRSPGSIMARYQGLDPEKRIDIRVEFVK